MKNLFEIILLCIGFFDLFVFASIVIINIIVYRSLFLNNRSKYQELFMYASIAIFYGISAPTISMIVELHQIDLGDAFEGIYTYFKFPIYWFLGLLQVSFFIVTKFRNKDLTINVSTNPKSNDTKYKLTKLWIIPVTVLLVAPSLYLIAVIVVTFIDVSTT